MPEPVKRPVSVTVHLSDGTDVGIWPDGVICVDVAAMRAARHDLDGKIFFNPDGTILLNAAVDAYVYAPLKPHVLRAAVNAAWKKARFARRAAAQIAKARGPAERLEPGTLQHLVGLAEGIIREDGWPKGHIPL